jgi:hypothetical protein
VEGWIGVKYRIRRGRVGMVYQWLDRDGAFRVHGLMVWDLVVVSFLLSLFLAVFGLAGAPSVWCDDWTFVSCSSPTTRRSSEVRG